MIVWLIIMMVTVANTVMAANTVTVAINNKTYTGHRHVFERNVVILDAISESDDDPISLVS